LAKGAQVTSAEVDQAFYDSHRDSGGKLPPELTDPVTGNPRKLTTSAKDRELRKEWAKIRNHLQEVKNCAPPKGGAPIGPVAACPLQKNPDAPLYEPDKWNKDPNIKNSTNCYAYAMDSRTGHPVGDKPQPGQKSSTASTLDCASLKAAVLADGAPDDIVEAPQCPYQKQHNLPPPERPGYYQVALVRTSRQNEYDPKTNTYYYGDYHWYRENGDGTWSHKPGHGEAQDKDSDGKPITNPQTAARKSPAGTRTVRDPVTGTIKSATAVLDYDDFCGYFYVKKGGTSVGN
jgi:hypothetical protein